MIDWPEKLIGDLARRRAVVVIGSGVSRHAIGRDGKSRPPTWKAFLEKAVIDCPSDVPAYVSEAIDEGDLLHACEWLKGRFDENWVSYLRGIFQAPQFHPGELHQHIVKLDSRIVFSLNFDDIYERAANGIRAGSHIVKNYFDSDISEFLREDGRYIVKVHGGLNNPDKLIFTQNEYAKARMSYSAFYSLFDAALLTHSFIFLGVGYRDPDVSLILENQRFGFPGSLPHFFVTAKQLNLDLQKSLRENRNLKVVEYDKVDDNHSGLLTAIQELALQVEDCRQDLTATTNW